MAPNLGRLEIENVLALGRPHSNRHVLRMKKELQFVNENAQAVTLEAKGPLKQATNTKLHLR